MKPPRRRISYPTRSTTACGFALRLALIIVAFLPSPALCDDDTTDAKTAPDDTKATALFNQKNLDGWRIIDTFDFKRHGKVEVVDGTVVLGAGSPATGISYTGKLPRIDYEISLQAKRIEGDDFFCGLTFPVNDSHLSLIIGGWGGGVTGISNLDDRSAVENETTGYTEFERDRWYRIRLRVTAEVVQAWLDDEKIVDVKIKDKKLSIWWEQEPARPLGIVTWYTKGAVKEVVLTRLGEEK
jgi:hypothetical protein